MMRVATLTVGLLMRLPTLVAMRSANQVEIAIQSTNKSNTVLGLPTLTS